MEQCQFCNNMFGNTQMLKQHQKKTKYCLKIQETKAKEDAIVKRLDTVIRYLKDKYILKSKDFDTNLKDAYLEYCSYCVIDGSKECCKIEFNKRLEALNITSFKSGNIHNRYRVKHCILMDIANKNKWLHSTDIFETDDKFDDEKDVISDLDMTDKDREIDNLKKQIEELKKQLEVKKEVVIEEVKPNIDMTVMANSYNEFSLTVDSMMKHIKKDKKRLKEEKKTGDFCSFLDNLDELCN